MELKVSEGWLRRQAKLEDDAGDCTAGGFGTDVFGPGSPFLLRAEIAELHKKIDRIKSRISDGDHSDELAQDIADILGIELKLNE